MAVSREPDKAQTTIKRLQAIDRERKQEQTQAGFLVHFNPSLLFAEGTPENPEELADALLNRLVVTKVRPATRDAIVTACRSVSPTERPALAARLILASPEYEME
jgi:hypothetical protein